MPTLRLIYLPELYAGVTEDETNNTTTTSAAELPTTRIHEQSRFPIDDATRNASSNNKEPPAVGGEKMEATSDDHEEEGDDYIDTLLQEAIDEVNRRTCSSSSQHAVRHQQVPHEVMALSSDEESENESSFLEFVDKVQKFQDETVSSDEEIENDSTSSVHLDAIQQTSGNKRKRRAPQQSFDDRFNDLMAFKAKHGHCDVSQIDENASLGQWCTVLRGSYKKVQNNQKPNRKLSDQQIQRLDDAGFNWSLRTGGSGFDKRFNDLMAFKTKYGHCNVSFTFENASLGQWCCKVRGSYKQIQNNQKPRRKLSDEQIQRLNDAGFNWSLRKVGLAFNKRFNDLMAFNVKYGHCNVSQYGENASLGQWCKELRGSYKQIQNNQKPDRKLSDQQIQRLNDAGFKWSIRKGGSAFNKRFNDLMTFKTKYGHFNVSQYDENEPLGKWCSQLRCSYKKMHNNQKPRRKLSDQQIQRLNDAGFKWSIRKGESAFDKRLNDLMSFKAKYGHCNVSQYDENASLGKWCSKVRGSYKKMQNNQKPTNKLSDQQIQRLNDAGFKWRSLKGEKTFDERLNDLMCFKTKYGHCDVSQNGENASLGKWCCKLRGSYKKMQNNQKPITKLSDEQIQRLSDVGFKWSR
jgi:hypothetical protein